MDVVQLIKTGSKKQKNLKSWNHSKFELNLCRGGYEGRKFCVSAGTEVFDRRE